jgi:hypothetical protein
MTTREQFTDEEWATASALPGLVIMASCLADGKMVPSVREIAAGAGALTAGAAAHPENAVLQALVSKETKPDFGDAKPENVEAAVELLVTEIGESAAALKAKVGTEEYAEIGGVLMAVAHAVVERLGTGFMGGGSEKVSAGEQSFVDRLATILA